MASKKNLRLLIILDAIETINPFTDTTLVIIEEAAKRGHALDVCQPIDLELDGPEVRVAKVLTVSQVTRERGSCILGAAGESHSLAEYDAVLMRKDPPFDQDFYYATLLLERARGKTLLVNDPRGLRDANEKLFIFQFPELIAPTRVTASMARLRECLTEWGGEMIVKPLDGCGGDGIFHVRKEDRNTNVIFETISAGGRRLVMAQKYLPEARQGDKRILLLDGQPIGAVLRVPRADETRGNLHVGGTAVKTTLTERDREICAAVGPRCHAEGLYFVGLDVIGGKLTEVNVTSPTGVQEIDRLDGVCLEARIVDWLESRTASGNRSA